MQENYSNKQMEPGQNKTIAQLEKYHFSGGGEYEPITIEASNISAAQKLWESKRKHITPPNINLD